MDIFKNYNIKQGVVEHVYHLTTWEVQATGLGVQGHLWLHSKLEASLGHMRLSLKRQKPTNQANHQQSKTKQNVLLKSQKVIHPFSSIVF